MLNANDKNAKAKEDAEEVDDANNQSICNDIHNRLAAVVGRWSLFFVCLFFFNAFFAACYYIIIR